VHFNVGPSRRGSFKKIAGPEGPAVEMIMSADPKPARDRRLSVPGSQAQNRA
jgi:hypothetical protein